jgi:hypothetical protein
MPGVAQSLVSTAVRCLSAVVQKTRPNLGKASMRTGLPQVWMELLRVSAGQRPSLEVPVTEDCCCSYTRMS